MSTVMRRPGLAARFKLATVRTSFALGGRLAPRRTADRAARLFVLVGHDQARTPIVEGLGAGPGDGVLVGNADNEALGSVGHETVS